MMRVWCLSVAYIGPKSRTVRPRKTKIGTEVAHVTRESDTTFKVKRSKINLQGAGAYCGNLPHSLLELYNWTAGKTSADLRKVMRNPEYHTSAAADRAVKRRSITGTTTELFEQTWRFSVIRWSTSGIVNALQRESKNDKFCQFDRIIRLLLLRTLSTY